MSLFSFSMNYIYVFIKTYSACNFKEYIYTVILAIFLILCFYLFYF